MVSTSDIFRVLVKAREVRNYVKNDIEIKYAYIWILIKETSTAKIDIYIVRKCHILK